MRRGQIARGVLLIACVLPATAHAGEIKVKTSQNWKTMLELSFIRMGNLDRRKSGDRRHKSSDRRLPARRG